MRTSNSAAQAVTPAADVEPSAAILPSDPDALVKDETAAIFLNSTVAALRKQRELGKGPPYVKLSQRSILYKVGDLLRHVRERTVVPGGRHV